MSAIKIITKKPIAFDSPDHIKPRGTLNDNSINLKFNEKLFDLIPSSELRVLDLGCAGGGFVKTVIDAGGFAVGIEGSDHSKKLKRAEWGTIPGNLFTADVTEPFELLGVDAQGQGCKLKFNVITAWEFLEHINESELASVFKNIDNLLLPGGMVIMSITNSVDIHEDVVLHQTVKGRAWWTKKLLEFGFIHHPRAVYYFTTDWVRGGHETWFNFHVILTRIGEKDALKGKLHKFPLSIKWILSSAIVELLEYLRIPRIILFLKNKVKRIIKYKK